MTGATTFPRVLWPEGWDERSEFETPMRGYLSHTVVELPDGTRYPVFFYDPIRLSQDLESCVGLGEPFVAEPGMIILPEVTPDRIQAAVQQLWEQGYFDHLKPLQTGNIGQLSS